MVGPRELKHRGRNTTGELSQTLLTILSCKGLHKCRAVESQDTGFEKEQVKMQDVIPKSNYIMIA